MAKRLATQVVIAAFQDEEAVDRIEKMVCDAEWDSKQIICTNMAKAKKDVAGQMTVKELGKPSDAKAAAAGGTIGGLLGGLSLFLLGPAGAAAGAAAGGATGAAIAGYANHQVEGLDKDKLNKLGSALKPGTSAIVLVFDEVLVSKAEYEKELEIFKESTDALVDIIASKIKENLEAGNDIAFQVAIAEDGMAASRFVVGEEAVNIRNLVLTPESVSAAEMTATEKGVATEAVIATPEEVVTARTVLTSSICAYEVTAVTEDAAVYEAGVEVQDKQLEG